MPFARMPAVHPNSLSGKVKVGLGWGRGKNLSALIRVHFGKEVGSLIRVAPDDRLEVQWGHGSDAGKLLFQKVQSGGRKIHQPSKGAERTGSMAVAFGSLPRKPLSDDKRQLWALKMEKHSMTECPWSLYPAGGIIATLPEDWWQIEKSGVSGFNPYPKRAA